MRIRLFGVLLGGLMGLVKVATAQELAKDMVLRETRVEVLEALSTAWQMRDVQAKERALQEAISRGWPTKIENELTGEVIEICKLAPWGEPIYRVTDNRIAARTIATNRVYPNGGLGYNLTGSGLNIGIWDGGAVRRTHREFTINRVTQVDNVVSQSSHATHVAGTLIASGVDTNARGMAYQASLRAYDWNSDNSEMTTAAANGLLISNHSYGWIAGWNSAGTLNGTTNYWYGWEPYSLVEDYKFGYYDEQARDWDQIANNAPFYLIVKSAGNDRGESRAANTSHNVQDSVSPFGWRFSTRTRNADGNSTGYDCITGGGVGKNILTIGAVSGLTNGYTNASGVTMSSFSGWGPTDDGRIKPDLVAKGVSTYSTTTTHDSAYTTLSGTSMASPSAAGSLLLLQQHFSALKGRFMRSSTLKGLAIHTADEAGTSDGPDYRFGWGLINIGRAATLIAQDGTNQHVIEDSLLPAQTWELELYSDGATPLRATLAWNDPFATLVAHPNLLNNPALRLINDLDMRVVRNSDNNTFQPWILNPASPANAATTGDNFRDNVEQVLIAAPAAGWYTLRITHKGNLRNNQRQLLSLIISGANRLNTFTGNANWTSNTNWTASSNPTGTTDALVKSGTLTISSTAQVRNLWVKSGATVIANASLTVNGSLVNSGSFSNSNLLTLNSTAAHDLKGGFSLNQLTKSGTGALTISGDSTRISNRLTISAGTINTNGRIVLQNGAQLIDNASVVNPGGAIIGEVHYERIGTNHGRVYNFWSSPVALTMLIATFAGSAVSDLRRFDASTQTWISANGSMAVGTGYTATGSGSGLRRFSGQPNNGNISLNVTSNAGGNNDWNLIGNPYPSPLSALAFVSANSSRINGSLYFWDRTMPYGGGAFVADYAVWNIASQTSGTGGRVPTGWIQPCQGFFVEAVSTGAINFNNAMRGSGNGVFFRNTQPAARYWLSMTQNENSNQIAVVFRDDATAGFDPMLDAKKLKTQSFFNVSTLAQDEALTIQSLPVLQDFQQIPLQIDLAQGGVFRLVVDSVEGNHPAGSLRLWDTEEQKIYPLQPGIAVELSVNGSLLGSKRYSLIWGNPKTTSIRPSIQTFHNSYNSAIRINNPGKLKIDQLEVYELSGRLVWSEILNTQAVEFERNINFSSGIYLVRLNGNFEAVTTKLFLTR